MKEVTSEFSYPVDVNRIPAVGLSVNLRADKEQCRALARRFGLPSVLELSAELNFKRINKKRVRLDASFDAKVEQVCVVTLKPFVQQVKDRFSMVFCQEEETSVRLNEIDLDMSEEDEIEFFKGDKIDAGEIVAESFSLALDPFPHAPDATFRAVIDDDTDKNAFSVLEKLKFK